VRQASVEVIDLEDIEKAALSEGGSTSSSSSSGKAEKQEVSNREPLALDRGPMSSNEVMRIIDQQPIEVASLLRTWADEAVSN
jgi:flagellar biosynthesis/type III secretory pathway M-ring protein FliF/YscJ